ncbi:MAG TPA: LysE family transporter [Pseudonocardiaceae bacterium]|nr:LysE family transporter [Pseudonocardiaceae bacterium]
MSALVAGLLAGYGAAIPIGAIGALLITLAARTSLRVSAAAALGVATVDGAYALVAMLGGNAMAAAIAHVAGPMRWIAAGVLAAIAVRTALAALRRTDTPGVALTTPLRAYLTLIGLTALNPTTVVYFAALAVGRQTTSDLFVVAVFVSSASWQLVLACGGRLLGRFVDTPRGRLVTGMAAALVVLALAVKLAW